MLHDHETDAVERPSEDTRDPSGPQPIGAVVKRVVSRVDTTRSNTKEVATVPKLCKVKFVRSP